MGGPDVEVAEPGGPIVPPSANLPVLLHQVSEPQQKPTSPGRGRAPPPVERQMSMLDRILDGGAGLNVRPPGYEMRRSRSSKCGWEP
jgi:hypothetical protein